MFLANLILQFVTVPFTVLLAVILLVNIGFLSGPKGLSTFVGWLFIIATILMALAGGIYLTDLWTH